MLSPMLKSMLTCLVESRHETQFLYKEELKLLTEMKKKTLSIFVLHPMHPFRHEIPSSL